MVQINPPPSTFLSVAAGQADTISMALFQACLTAAATATSISAQEEIECPLRVPIQQQERCLIACKGAGQQDSVQSRLRVFEEWREVMKLFLSPVTLAQREAFVCIHFC